MRERFTNQAVLGILLIWQFSVCFGTEIPDANDSSKYLDAVREFADNVLKYGRDTYGPKHTPLFVDGLNVNTHEPVKWISPKGDVLTATETEEWIISNFASQQTLLRTLDGLSTVTGDPKYRDAAMQVIGYTFEHLMAPNGLLYWGHSVAYDVQEDKVKKAGPKYRQFHSLKIYYPYYELMWQVDPGATKKVIESFWSAHVLDWSNLDFNRYSFYSDSFEKPWDHGYKREPTFFMGKNGACGFFHSGTSLVYSGIMLYQLEGQEQPLIWSKRLMQRFVDTRHPKTGISAHLYNRPQRMFPNDSMAHNFIDRRTTVFPFHPFERKRNGQLMNLGEHWQPLPWLSLLFVGDELDEQGKEFTQWVLEELTAWAKASYRKKDNAFVPILTDGTNIEGVVLDKDCNLGPRGDIATPLIAGPECFWLYATAYRATNDEFMWQIARNIAIGNNLGDIGEISGQRPEFNIDVACSDVYSLLGFLELYSKTKDQEFLLMARHIADNIVETKFHQGLFVSSKQHVYSRFDCLEPLALLHLAEALNDRKSSMPRIWPTSANFVRSYRYKLIGCDRWHIYRLTESSEVPWSLQELAHIGDIDKIRSLINSGVQVDSWDESSAMTALQRAAISGHKDVAEFLIAKGAQIDYIKSDTALHYAIRYGRKTVVELLLSHGADFNLKDQWGHGRTPLDIAIGEGHMDIAKLLVDKGAKASSFTDHYIVPWWFFPGIISIATSFLLGGLVFAVFLVRHLRRISGRSKGFFGYFVLVIGMSLIEFLAAAGATIILTVGLVPAFMIMCVPACVWGFIFGLWLRARSTSRRALKTAVLISLYTSLPTAGLASALMMVNLAFNDEIMLAVLAGGMGMVLAKIVITTGVAGLLIRLGPGKGATQKS